MLSDILKMTATNEMVVISKRIEDTESDIKTLDLKLICCVRRVIAERMGKGELTINNAAPVSVKISIENDVMTITNDIITMHQFFPNDMQRCIIKDLNKQRPFDIEYRKHLVYDFSKNHYNVIIPYDVSDTLKNHAIEIIKSHSTGKSHKPTGIILTDKLIVLKDDNHYQYELEGIDTI